MAGLRWLSWLLVLGSAASLRSLVPLYFYPATSRASNGTLLCTDTQWLSVAEGGSSVMAIINPASGPVDIANPARAPLVACSKRLAERGVKLIGYVPTKLANETSPGVWKQYGFRSLASVAAMIDEWYNDREIGPILGGIFVDEVSNMWSATKDKVWGDHSTFYRTIFASIRDRSSSATVVANSGGPPPDMLITSGGADVVVIFEAAATKWDPSFFAPPGSVLAHAGCQALLHAQNHGAFDPGPWCPFVPKVDGVDALVAGINSGRLRVQLAALVYGAKPANTSASWLGNTALQADESNVTYLYVTEQYTHASRAYLAQV